MKRFAFLLSAPLLAALLAVFAGTGRAIAADPPDPDLTGDWLGSFESIGDPLSPGEAAMSVDSQERQQFKGKLMMGRLVFAIQGFVASDPPTETDPPQPDRGEGDPPSEAEPPQPDRQLLIVGIDPPDPDMPGAMILVRGTVRFAEPPNPDADPPSPDADPPSEIVADYLIIYSDGSTDMGKLELVPAVRPR